MNKKINRKLEDSEIDNVAGGETKAPKLNAGHVLRDNVKDTHATCVQNGVKIGVSIATVSGSETQKGIVLANEKCSK